MPGSLELSSWPRESVSYECRAAYPEYSRALDRHYGGYFASRAEERGAHPRQARNVEPALPPGFTHLADCYPRAPATDITRRGA